jgi:type IV pilus assembly protein PilV
MKLFLLRRHIARAQRGVALLECLMALLIFSVGLLGLLGLEARVMNISVDSENRNRAAMLAGEIASQMWLNNTVTPATPATANTPAYNALLTRVADQTQGGLPGGVPSVVPVVGTTNAADITISWQESSDPAGQLSKLTTRVILP